MKIVSLTKKKNGLYEVQLENKTLILNEDTIIQFRLFENQDIDIKSFPVLEQFDYLKAMEKKAIDYAFRYGKSSKEVCLYLESKGLSKEQALELVDRLVFNKWIDDKSLALNMASAYARNSNGPLMIKEKLKKHLFSADLIEQALMAISRDDIEIGIERLNKKFNQRYAHIAGAELKLKKKEFFYRHGYMEVEV